MRRISADTLAFSVVGYVLVSLVAIVCVMPFIIVISGSLSSQETILRHGYSLLPRAFSLEAYRVILTRPEALARAYAVTTAATLAGTLVGLFITAMTAFVLAQKDFPWRNRFSFYFYFTVLFNGGLVPWYILCVRYLQLRDSFLALVLPFMLNVFYILVMKSFMKTIPEAIAESAKMDGANDFVIFLRLILPLSKPALASIGLFISLGYWNDWYTTFMFIQNQNLFSLQFYLYKIIVGADALRRLTSIPGFDRTQMMPTESLKLAMTVVTTGPIVLLYPLAQRYFITGLTIGAVKG